MYVGKEQMSGHQTFDRLGGSIGGTAVFYAK
jgi:hypothetical protein